MLPPYRIGRRYLAYMVKKPYAPPILRRVGFEDALQEVMLAWCELGQPQELDFAVMNRAWCSILRLHRRAAPLYVMPDMDLDPAPQDSHAPGISCILDHYERNTASQTIAHFGLPDNARVRRWLGRCCPKHERAGGKRYRERRLKVYTRATSPELITAGVPRATAWRAAKRGYYWAKQ